MNGLGEQNQKSSGQTPLVTGLSKLASGFTSLSRTDRKELLNRIFLKETLLFVFFQFYNLFHQWAFIIFLLWFASLLKTFFFALTLNNKVEPACGTAWVSLP